MSQQKKRSWVFGLAIVGVLVGSVVIARVLVATAPKAERRAPERQARLVDVTRVEPGTHTVMLTANGTVRAAQRVSLTAQVSGVVAELSPAFEPGAAVKQGDLLLRIDDRDARLALARARADLAAAQAALAQEQGNQVVARADLALLDTELSAEEQALVLRQPQLQAAQAQVAVARAAVATAELDLSRTAIRAPFDARVVSRSVAVGAQVGGAGTVLGDLAASETYWVTLMVAVDALRWLPAPDEHGKGGAAVQITDTSQPQAEGWPGRVIRVLDEVESNGRRAQLLVEVAPVNAQGDRLLLGSYVSGRLQGRALESVYALSPGWLQQGKLWQVLDGQLRSLAISVLHADAQRVLARPQGADKPGSLQILTSAVSGAVDGMAVRTRDDLAEANTAERALGRGAQP